MRSKAQRRHNDATKKAKRSTYEIYEGWKDGHIKNWEHPKKCSCWLCGNPRKDGHKTKQELQSEASTSDALIAQDP